MTSFNHLLGGVSYSDSLLHLSQKQLRFWNHVFHTHVSHTTCETEFGEGLFTAEKMFSPGSFNKYFLQ